jgi:hypothetical protein
MGRLRLLHLLTLVIISTLVLGHAKTAKPAPEEETVPHNVVLRLLNSFGAGCQLFVGQLPKQLPVDLPLPDGAKVVASVVRQPDNFQILLDAPQSPEQVQAFYQERLSAAGWQSWKEPSFERRGFTPSKANLSNASSLIFCNKSGGAGASLSIVARTGQESPTDVRLNLNTDSRNSICDPRVSRLEAEAFESDEKIPFPNLPAPLNTQVSPTRGGGSDRSWYSTATLVSKLDIQSLLAHYENQFKQAGWTKLDGKQNESMSWSNWTMKDTEGKFWQGVLNLRKVEGMPNRYSAYAIVF